MDSKWIFIGGMLAGVASVFAAAAVAVEWEGRKSGGSDAVAEKEKLALPEMKKSGHHVMQCAGNS